MWNEVTDSTVDAGANKGEGAGEGAGVDIGLCEIGGIEIIREFGKRGYKGDIDMASPLKVR